MKRKIVNLYNRFTGKHEKAFNKLREDYTNKCLEFEFLIIEAQERATSFKTTLKVIADSSTEAAIKILANQELAK